MECIKNTQACKFWPCQARRGDNVGLCVLVMQWYLVVKVAYFMRWYEYQAGQQKLNGAMIFMTLHFMKFEASWLAQGVFNNYVNEKRQLRTYVDMLSVESLIDTLFMTFLAFTFFVREEETLQNQAKML